MKEFFLLLTFIFCSSLSFAQDTTNNDFFDPTQFEDGAKVTKFCTQKVLNQTPTKMYGIGYEHNFSFSSSNSFDPSHTINSMGGL